MDDIMKKDYHFGNPEEDFKDIEDMPDDLKAALIYIIVAISCVGVLTALILCVL
jgi:hypothetical protein